MSEAIDISGFKPADTTDLQILQPGTDKPTGWVVTLAGPSHPKAIAWASANARQGLRR
jgi:hypothetical protein